MTRQRRLRRWRRAGLFWRTACSLVPLFAISSVTDHALAQDVDPINLQWNAPPGCPSSDVVQRRVIELSGPLVRKRPLSAIADVVADDKHVRLHLETQDGGQTFVRDVTLPTCEQAAETAALILAMALRAELAPQDVQPASGVVSPQPLPEVPAPAASSAPSLIPNKLPPPPLPLPQSPVDVSPPETKTPVPAPEAVPEGALSAKPETPSAPRLGPSPRSVDTDLITLAPARFHFAGSLGGTVTWALVPKAQWAISAAVAWLPGPFRLEVGGALAPPQRYAVNTDETRGGEFVWWSAAVRGCYTLKGAQVDVSPLGARACIGGEAGQLRGTAFGTTLREEGVSPWAAVFAGLGGELALAERVLLFLRVEVAAPFWRDRFVLRNTEEPDALVARPALVVGRLGAGVEVLF